MITNIAVIEDNIDFESYGTSPSFPVPDRFVKKIIETDLSQVMNEVFTKDDEEELRRVAPIIVLGLSNSESLSIFDREYQASRVER